MPNVLDAEPMRALARRAAIKIKQQQVAARFEKLAFAKLLDDPNNFRPATDAELDGAPDWVDKALKRGEQIGVFRPNRTASTRLHTLARRLADTCTLSETPPHTQPGAAHFIDAAQRFLDTIERSSFEIIARKALRFSRILLDWRASNDHAPLCPPQEIAATPGHVWKRIRSFGELRAVGREFQNCLARASLAGAYGRRLRDGSAQFWVLRGGGRGAVIVMAPAPATPYFLEVRGPNNALVPPDHPDLACLADALGMTSPEKQPPPLPAPPLNSWAPAGRRPYDGDIIELLGLLRRRVA